MLENIGVWAGGAGGGGGGRGGLQPPPPPSQISGSSDFLGSERRPVFKDVSILFNCFKDRNINRSRRNNPVTLQWLLSM